MLLLDVTPLTLGIETLGGVRTPLIQRNTTIPTKKSQIFSTADENQTAVTINILQGEREMANDNKSLGRFDLIGIPPAPRGIPQIEVSFDIDANGIVNVSAKDLGTGKEQGIKITASQKLNEKEVEKMKKEAEQYAEEDKKRKEEVDTKNQADSLVYTIEKTIKDIGDKADKNEIKEIEKEKDELKEIIKENKISEIKNKMEEINKKLQAMTTKLYQNINKENNKTNKKDDAIDAEVVDDDDKK